MWIFLTALCIIILLMIFMAVCKWRIEIKYSDNKLKVKIGVLTVYSSSKQTKDGGLRVKLLGADYKEVFKNLKQIKAFLKNEKEDIILILKKLEKELVVERIDLSVTFGFSNAAATGIANGAIWGVITAAVSFVDKYLNIKNKINIALTPDYTEKCFNMAFGASFKMRPYKIYYIAKRAMPIYERYNKQSKIY
ncbi:MAG: DUF2953 domain-containing protein [Firmicutes bacterium]|nr:DUF2953 domain-containing protein [Bacillota bacterium]